MSYETLNLPTSWKQMTSAKNVKPSISAAAMIRLLELFVVFLQAYIFTFLTTLFIASAVAPEH